MRVQVICRACAKEASGIDVAAAEATASPRLESTGLAAPEASAPMLSSSAAAEDAYSGSEHATGGVGDALVRTGSTPSHKAPRASGLVLVGLAGLASVAFFGWRAVRPAAPPAGGLGASVAPSGSGTGRSSPVAGIGITAASGEDFDVSQPAPAGLEAVLSGTWTHPLAGPHRELPHNDVQRFGAYRARDEFFKRYCGSGHCGVDIGLVVGLPVIAARDGVIDRAVYEPTELEGKYIRLAHAGGVYTYYMHLDEVAPGLRKGVAVKAGQMIGTLGHTGIRNSAAHLHFMIAFESRGKELYVDPEPLLESALLVEIDPMPEWALLSELAR